MKKGKCGHEEKFFDAYAKPITSVSVLLRELKKLEELPGVGMYFRGQGNEKDGLLPTIGRTNFYKLGGKPIGQFTETQEKELLHRFTRYAYAMIERLISKWEALFLARHHGLPVRLLDWTSNPLVALYHAVLCEEKSNDNGAIWVFKKVENKPVENKPGEIDVLKDIKQNISPFCYRGVKIIYPIYASPRMVAQSGFFTLHGNPWSDLKDDDPSNHSDGEFDIKVIRKWVIPAKKKLDLIKELERLSINYRTLYPDLDGIAKGLWQLEVIRKY